MTVSCRLFCNGEYPYWTCPARTFPWPTLEIALSQAAQDGWLTRDSGRNVQHYCPDCQRAGRHNQAVTQ